jgi:molecular chaperone HtpG
VLLLTDPIDDFVVQSLHQYKDKPLKAADKGQPGGDQVDAAKKEHFQPLLDFFKQQVTEVKDVRLSGRLKDSAACLVSDDADMGAHMERILQRMGREVPASKRVLELNADHPALQAVQNVFQGDRNDPRIPLYCRLLYDEALIGEGSKVTDVAAFAKRINELLLRDATPRG